MYEPMRASSKTFLFADAFRPRPTFTDLLFMHIIVNIWTSWMTRSSFKFGYFRFLKNFERILPKVLFVIRTQYTFRHTWIC